MSEEQAEYNVSGEIIMAGKAIAKAQFTDRKTSIPYRPEYNKAIKYVAASILFQQLWYWWEKMGGKFWKYRDKCKADDYRDGDSWLEELQFTGYQFDKALDILGKKVTSGTSKAEAYKKSIVIWWTDSNRKTWYKLNETNYFYIVGLAYSNPDIFEENSVLELLDNFYHDNYIENDQGKNPLYTKTTTETTTDSTNPKKQTTEEIIAELEKHQEMAKERSGKNPRAKQILEAMAGGEKQQLDIKSAFAEHLGLTPPWNYKSNREHYQFFRKEAEKGRHVQQFAEWWFREDWRGKDNQSPSMNQVRTNWLQAFKNNKQPQKRKTVKIVNPITGEIEDATT